jgi:hypothetical protein
LRIRKKYAELPYSCLKLRESGVQKGKAFGEEKLVAPLIATTYLMMCIIMQINDKEERQMAKLALL